MRQDADRAHRLLDAVAATAAEGELPEVLRRFVHAAVALTGAGQGALGVLAADGAGISELVHVGMDEQATRRIDDPRDDAGDDVALRVPVEAHGTVLGWLYLAGKDAGFTAEDERLARALAAAAGTAVRNARLHAQTRSREAWLRASTEITAALLAAEHPVSELQLVTARARHVAGAPIAAIALPDRWDPDKLVFGVVDGLGDRLDRVVGVTIDVANTASGTVYRTGMPLLLDSYGEAAAAWHGEDTPFSPVLSRLGSAAIVPLAAGKQTLGVLVLCRRRGERPFDRADLRLLENFAAHAALALQYARAQADQHRLALAEERDRIARDLHDLVIQRLFATGMALESAANMIGANPGAATERIRRAVDDLDQTIREVRTTVFALQQPAGSEPSLRARVIETVSAAARVLGFTPSVRFDGPVDTLVDEPVRGHLLAVLREALSNAARHARATALTVEVSVRDGDVALRVADNGVGMPEGVPRSGLANMAVRAERLGGSFTAEPADRGTELRWRVPVTP